MNREQMEELITRHEGKRSTVYKDTVGILTIGIGFNLEKKGAAARIASVNADYTRICLGADALTETQILALFALDLDDAIRDARAIVPNFDEHPDEVQSVIVDMVFNLGAAGFAKFKKLIAALKAKDYCEAAAQMSDSRWAIQTGTRAHENVLLVMEYCKAA